MPTFSFSEKDWDKIRPSTLKKTGVSEAMRAVLKDVPKDLRSFAKAGECDGAAGLLAALQTALEKSLGQIKPKLAAEFCRPRMSALLGCCQRA